MELDRKKKILKITSKACDENDLAIRRLDDKYILPCGCEDECECGRYDDEGGTL